MFPIWRERIRSRVFILRLEFGYLHRFCLADFFVPVPILAIAFGLKLHVAADLVYSRGRHVGLLSGCYVDVRINFAFHHLGVERLVVRLTCSLLREVALYTEILCSTLRAQLEFDHLASIHEMVLLSL